MWETSSPDFENYMRKVKSSRANDNGHVATRQSWLPSSPSRNVIAPSWVYATSYACAK